MVAVRKAVVQRAICGLLPTNNWPMDCIPWNLPPFQHVSLLHQTHLQELTLIHFLAQPLLIRPRKVFTSSLASCPTPLHARFAAHQRAAHPTCCMKLNPEESRAVLKGPFEFYHPCWRRPLGWSPWGEWQGRCGGHCRLSSAECSKPHCETQLSHWWSVRGGIAWRFAQYICSKREKSTKIWQSFTVPEWHSSLVITSAGSPLWGVRFSCDSTCVAAFEISAISEWERL